MADDKEESGKESAAEEYRRRMREAIADAQDGRVWAELDAFLRTAGEPPAGLAGDRDRTHSFYGTTTILKTLGPEEGLKAAMEYNPDLDEVATAYLVALHRSLKEDAPEVYARRLRRAIARACNELCNRLGEVMAYADTGQHHAITTLMGECRWCAREVCGDEATSNACDLNITLYNKENK